MWVLGTSDKGAAHLEHELGIGTGCLPRQKREFAEEGADAFPSHDRLMPDRERGQCVIDVCRHRIRWLVGPG